VETADALTEDVADESELVGESEDTIEVQSADSELLDSGTCGSNLTWTLSGDYVLTISGSGSMKDYDVSYTSKRVPWYTYRYDIKKVIIQEGVTSIGSSAFDYCSSVTSITIPDSVTSIGDVAFYGCDSLKDVYYSGSESDWNKISIGSANTCLTNATIHYNSSGPNTNPTKTALSKATVTLSKTSVAYTGKVQKPAVTVKVNGVTVPSSEYTVSYSNNTKVGTAKVTIKATSKATYVSGSVTKSFTITKAANPLTVSPGSKSLTVAKCKKKAQTFTIKVSKAQGTVSYKSSKTKYVTVSKDKVTVKKGTPKGTYKVTVTAKGNKNYNSGSKNVTITVK
jgi:hypothetical protein